VPPVIKIEEFLNIFIKLTDIYIIIMQIKVLILGSSGLLGNRIYNHLIKKKYYKIYHNGLNKKKFDLTNYINLEKLISLTKFDFIINCSALTNIDICQKFKKKSFNINVKLIENIFSIKKKNNFYFKLIHFSTDQVYNSKKKIKLSEKKNSSINIYCKHKILSEKICIKNKGIAFRTNFFGFPISKKRVGFLCWVLDNFKSQKNFSLVKDTFFNPLSITSLCKIVEKVMIKLNNNKIFGIYNLGSNSGILKYKLAINFAKKLNFYNNNYKIVDSKDIYSTKRSKIMFMDTTKFKKTFKIYLNDIQKEIKTELNFLKNDENWTNYNR